MSAATLQWLLCGLMGATGLGAHAQAPTQPQPAQARTFEPRLSGLTTSNPFDPQRKPWPDAVPVVPPPPPPPAPVPVTEVDFQIYGVVVVGDTRKAILKLGPRFAGVPSRENGFTTLSEGASVGEFVLARVEPDQVLLQATGGQQWVRFNNKKDRVATAVQQGAKGSAPMQGIASSAQPGGTMPLSASRDIGGNFPGANGVAPSTFVPPAAPPSGPPANGAGSLAAAIAAAQSGQAPVAPAITNPFLQLLQGQQK